MEYNILISEQKFIWIASFDIGKKNFSFYIEEFNIKDLKSITNIDKLNRFNPDGTCTEKFNELLQSIYKGGKKILLENVDLTENCDPKAYLDPQTFYNMTELLDTYSEYWSQCDIFIIEKQMSFGNKYNTMALKLGQHCWSYFSIKYPKNNSPEIIEFPAYYKTQILGAIKDKKTTKGGKVTYKAVDKPARKKWCVNTALTILESRGDNETITQITKVKKKDDLADVICQLQAFKYCYFIDNKII